MGAAGGRAQSLTNTLDERKPELCTPAEPLFDRRRRQMHFRAMREDALKRRAARELERMRIKEDGYSLVRMPAGAINLYQVVERRLTDIEPEGEIYAARGYDLALHAVRPSDAAKCFHFCVPCSTHAQRNSGNYIIY